MEEERRRSLTREEGTALVVVLLAIVILLPCTLVLATLALRWQQQSIDFRDRMSQELAAQAVFEEARARLAGSTFDIGPGEGRSFTPRAIAGIVAKARVSRTEDVVLTLDGRILRGVGAQEVDLDLTGTDPEGRVVYQFRKLELYLVEVEASRRPSLPRARLYGVLAKRPDGGFETLGVTLDR